MKTMRPWLPRLAGMTTTAGLAGVLLVGCATDKTEAPVEAVKPKPVPLDSVLADASRALAAGQRDKAQAMLTAATATYPGDKAPWLQLAQIKFDRASYGEAIVNAQAALQRDPGDKLANSIVAVSGLRLSTKALADLSQHNHLNGSLRSEAQELAKLLRSSLGEEVLVPTSAPPGAARKPANGKKAATARPAAAGSDPFSGLK